MSLSLDSLSVPVFLISGKNWSILDFNKRAQALFSCLREDKNHSFLTLFPDLNTTRLVRRLSRGMSFSFNKDIVVDKRTVPFNFTFRLENDDNIIVEGSDYSAIKESEAMLASYTEIIEIKNNELERERKLADELLSNILPQKCIDQIKKYGRTFPEKFASVSVMFLDFEDFTSMSSRMTPDKLFAELNEIFTRFDEIISEFNCERIKTIGDAYLAVCGMLSPTDSHAEKITLAALEIRGYIADRNLKSDDIWKCRIGIHTGPLMGGIVGKLKYIYDVFGDGVNIASRMESHSQPMQINISESTKKRLHSEFRTRSRGKISVKGQGEMDMFYVEGLSEEQLPST